MADTEKKGAEATMPNADINFLITCLQNATGGSICIDASAVGEVLGYTNTKSVANRISTLKKKYSLPFTSGSSKGVKGDAAAATSSPKAAAKTTTEAKAPSTPSKNRVSKRGAVKKAPAPKAPKGKGKVKQENSEDIDATEDGSGVDGGDELPDTPAKSEEAAEVNEDIEDEA